MGLLTGMVDLDNLNNPGNRRQDPDTVRFGVSKQKERTYSDVFIGKHVAQKIGIAGATKVKVLVDNNRVFVKPYAKGTNVAKPWGSRFAVRVSNQTLPSHVKVKEPHSPEEVEFAYVEGGILLSV